MVTYYHGGAAGIAVGSYVLPPSLTGAPTTADYGADGVCRRDKVYVTTNYEAALMYASMSPSGHTVYTVQPLGQVQNDPDCTEPGVSFECDRAWVLDREVLSTLAVAQIRKAVMALLCWHGAVTEPARPTLPRTAPGSTFVPPGPQAKCL